MAVDSLPYDRRLDEGKQIAVGHIDDAIDCDGASRRKRCCIASNGSTANMPYGCRSIIPNHRPPSRCPRFNLRVIKPTARRKFSDAGCRARNDAASFRSTNAVKFSHLSMEPTGLPRTFYGNEMSSGMRRVESRNEMDTNCSDGRIWTIFNDHCRDITIDGESPAYPHALPTALLIERCRTHCAHDNGVTDFGEQWLYHAKIESWDTGWVGRVIWDDGSTAVGHVAVEPFDAIQATLAAGSTVTINSVVDVTNGDLLTLVQGGRSYGRESTAIMDVYGIRRPESCRRLRQIAAAKLHSYNAAGSPGVADLSVDASVTQVGDVSPSRPPSPAANPQPWLPIPGARCQPRIPDRRHDNGAKTTLLNSDRRTSFDASFQHEPRMKVTFSGANGHLYASSATPMIWSGAMRDRVCELVRCQCVRLRYLIGLFGRR